MDMTIQEEIEQLVLRCVAADGLKACPKDISFLEKYRLKNLYFLSVRYRMYAREGKEALMRCLYLEEGYFRRFLEQTGLEDRI